MHETDTRGGLGHRRGCKPRPVGYVSDGREGYCERRASFDFVVNKIFNILIYNELFSCSMFIEKKHDLESGQIFYIFLSKFIYTDKP